MQRAEGLKPDFIPIEQQVESDPKQFVGGGTEHRAHSDKVGGRMQKGIALL